MKRYLLFSGMFYYPDGGWNDLDGDHDSLEEAVARAEQHADFAGWDWWHVVDLEQGAKVKDNTPPDSWP